MLQLKNNVRETSIGFAFVYFDNEDDIKIFKTFFKEFQYSKHVNHGQKFGVKNWTIAEAPRPSNIIWQ